jgi:AraC-like DNA-binding protein
MRSAFTTTQDLKAERRRYEQVIDVYLRECYATRRAARASAISRKLEANRSYVTEVVVRLFGKPLKAVLLGKQLARAARLLEMTALRVPEIGQAAGFGHRTTFHRVFKQAFGMQPAEYRRRATRSTHAEARRTRRR